MSSRLKYVAFYVLCLSCTCARSFRIPHAKMPHLCSRHHGLFHTLLLRSLVDENNGSEITVPSSKTADTNVPNSKSNENKSMTFLRKIGKVGGASNKNFINAVGVDEGSVGKSPVVQGNQMPVSLFFSAYLYSLLSTNYNAYRVLCSALLSPFTQLCRLCERAKMRIRNVRNLVS